jgi:hypothetical protein
MARITHRRRRLKTTGRRGFHRKIYGPINACISDAGISWHWLHLVEAVDGQKKKNNGSLVEKQFGNATERFIREDGRIMEVLSTEALVVMGR